MRWTAAIAASAALCLAAGCSGSSDGSHSPPPSTDASSTTAPPPSSSAPPSTPTAPATPTVPADVPTTGPNLRSPGERPPVEPTLATQHTAAGAKAFAEFFIQTIDWGFATMSGAYIRHYADESCLGCKQFADGIDRARAARHTYVGGWFTVRDSSTRRYSTTAASIAVRYDSLSFEEVDQQGKAVSANPAETNQTFVVTLVWKAGGWRTHALAVQT